MQRKIYEKQNKKCNIWLAQNLTSRKILAIMLIIEQMIKTSVSKEVWRLTDIASADNLKNNKRQRNI